MLDRRAIINGRMLLALWRNEEPPKLSDRARDLCDVSPRSHSIRRRSSGHGRYCEMFDALDACELEDVVAFFLMLDATTNPTDHRNVRDATLVGDYARAHDPGGVTIAIKNSDEDPCRLDLDVSDRIASAWADRHPSPVGGTWEPVDGEGFVYDTAIWHPKLVEELQEEGFDLDLSDFADPDEDEIAASVHACSGCTICHDDYRRALEHVRSEALEQTAHAQIGGVDDDNDDDAQIGESDALDATIRGHDDNHNRGAHP